MATTPPGTTIPPAPPVQHVVAKRQARLGVISGLNTALLYLILTVVAVAAVFPFWWMVVASTRSSATILNIPPPLTPGDALRANYDALMQQVPFWRAMGNSIFVSSVSTALVLFFCSLGGYAFAKFTFPGRNTLFALMLATMMIPNILGIIPQFILFKTLGWLDTYLPLIIPGVANAFGIFWMRQYIESAIPSELMDAARIDGAHEFRIYWNVVLPVITPGLAALAIFTFMGKWNEFFFPLIILKDPAKFTLPVALASLQSIYGQQIGVQILGATMAVFPVLIVFLVSARWFIAGLTAGALKGL
jgi:ABC-type glycerol-3-phosphate transport system permease component